MTKQQKYFLSKWVKPIFITPDQYSHWFGYYNYSPIDKDNKRMLAHRVNFDGRLITAEDTAEVGWFDLNDGSWNPYGITRAFNWQQGAMLQWLGPDFSKKVIYNDVEDGHFVSRITGHDGQKSRKIPWPVYGVTPDGQTSITLQFERCYWCRAYHYETVRNPEWNVRVAKDDGVFSVDLESGKVCRIISIDSVLQVDKDSSFDSAKHWLEHIMLNPSGNRFVFYHRYSEENGHRTRAFTAELNGTGLNLVPGWKENSYSHLGWRTDDEFVLFKYGRAACGRAYDAITNRNGLGKIIRYCYRRFLLPFVPLKINHTVASKTRYELYRVGSEGIIGEYSTGKLSNDGHPSFTVDGHYMLTDTYADSDGYRHLLLYNTRSNKLLELGRFFSPFNACEYRSDLHPRFNHDASMVVIDSAHSGKHQMMVLRLDWDGISDSLEN